ncbi:MAG: dUTP diphosphatase [Actinomycetota bacterium]|nr:dUTP diphosphatase [Actinomycetota bacterium]
MKIPVLRSNPAHRLPRFAQPGDAGADLVSCEAVTIAPGARALIATGVAIAIPEGYGGFVLPRSGLAVRTGVTVLNAPGLIDAGYRGEVKVALINHGEDPFVIEVGDRIAQLVVMAVEAPVYVQAESLEETSRGTGGFGSTGVKAD